MRILPLNELKNRIALLPEYTLADIYVRGNKVENFKAVVPKGMSIPIAIVSHKYKLIQHKTLFNVVIEKVSWKFGSNNILGDVYYHKNRAHLFLFFQKAKLFSEEYFAGILVTNSVDTSLSVKISLSLYNENFGIPFVNPKKLIEIKNKHIGLELFWDRFKSRLFAILNSYQEILKNYLSLLTKLSEININPKEILDKISLSKRLEEKIMASLKSPTLFDIYKAVVSCLISEPYISSTTKIKKIEKLGEIVYSFVEERR